MIVVADTSPLNYLVRLGHIEVLPLIYEQVVVPPAVLRELKHPNTPSKVREWIASPPAWLRQIPVKHLDGTLSLELGDGEREAISLALELYADTLLVDDF